MELYLHYTYNMRLLCLDLLKEWGECSIILSPKDIDKKNLLKINNELKASGAKTLFDPQIYRPTADHARLTQHDYWPSLDLTANFFSGTEFDDTLEKLYKLNRSLGTSIFILPGLFARKIEPVWEGYQEHILKSAAKLQYDGTMYATVAVSSDVINDQKQVHKLIEMIESWDVDGIYLVYEHPNVSYYITDPNWMWNLMDLVAGIRLRRKKVISAFSGHQKLIMGLAGCSALAVGNYLNSRFFDVARYKENDSESGGQQVLWYYAPNLYCEYNKRYLDTMKDHAREGEFLPTLPMRSKESEAIFAVARPSIPFDQRRSFRHYLICLEQQCRAFREATFDLTYEKYLNSLNYAERVYYELESEFPGTPRGPGEFFVCNRIAIQQFKRHRGAIIRRKWNSL